MPRPALDKSVGYTVEVPSDLPGSTDDDYYQGIVSKYDVQKGTITVRFLGHQDEPADEEDFRYANDDIAWMALPSTNKPR